MRLTALPLLGADGELVHVGIGLVRRQVTDTVRLSTGPESRLTSVRFVDTGRFSADAQQLMNLEAAWARGPLTVQSEYTRTDLSVGGRDPRFDGGYLQASYLLTGERRAYDKTAATFAGVVPLHPYSRHDPAGWGAWEVALRYSTVDLNPVGTPEGGGAERNIGAALNWYPVADTRLMLNCIRGDVDAAASGQFTTVQARLMYSF